MLFLLILCYFEIISSPYRKLYVSESVIFFIVLFHYANSIWAQLLIIQTHNFKVNKMFVCGINSLKTYLLYIAIYRVVFVPPYDTRSLYLFCLFPYAGLSLFVRDPCTQVVEVSRTLRAMWTPAFQRIPCYPLRLVCIFKFIHFRILSHNFFLCLFFFLVLCCMIFFIVLLCLLCFFLNCLIAVVDLMILRWVEIGALVEKFFEMQTANRYTFSVIVSNFTNDDHKRHTSRAADWNYRNPNNGSTTHSQTKTAAADYVNHPTTNPIDLTKSQVYITVYAHFGGM